MVSLTRFCTALFGAACLATACSAQPSSPIPGPSPAAVTFNITIDPAAFSNKRQITVSIWDAEQLAIADQTSGCSVSSDMNGTVSPSCPPGVQYRKPAPEEIMVSQAELSAPLVFASKTVTVGERYRVSVRGMATDDCNTASAGSEGQATTASVVLRLNEIAQTEMGCQPTRGQ